MNLIIDIGNTQTKVALADKANISRIHVEKKLTVSFLKEYLNKTPINLSIVSSVKQKDVELLTFLQSISKCITLSENSKTNFKNLYETPTTLGKDRIALAAAAQEEFKSNNVLVIDAGTCITYDLKTANAEYLGGAISPGLKMRFEALNHFTHGLPLVEYEAFDDFIGNNTKNNILSGVINGIINEVDGVINQYQQRFEDLKVVITGGDQVFFAEYLKNNFFARPYFIIKGLDVIAKMNA